jgi:hypothetical protein
LTLKHLSLTKHITNHQRSAHLALIAGLSGLIYGLIFTFRFPLSRFYATIPPVDYTKLTNYSVGGLTAYVLGIIVLFWLYLWAIRLARPGQPSPPVSQEKESSPEEPPVTITRHLPAQPPAVSGRFLLLTSTVLAAVSIPSYPLTAIDLFIYAIRTRGWALYGLNPLATAPEQLPATDPWLSLAAEWLDAPSPYGPVWEWLSLAAFYLSDQSFLGQLLALKFVAALAYLGCTWLVYLTLRRIRPEWAPAGTVAFAWNPLVLLESVQNGHNDIVMTLFLLAAVWGLVHLLSSKRSNDVPSSRLKTWILPLLICLALALSILVKFITLIVTPFFLLALAKRQPSWDRRLLLIGGLGLGMALVVVFLMQPLWPGWENRAVVAAGSQAGRSLLALLVLGLKDSWGVGFAFDTARAFVVGLLILIYLYFLWQTVAELYSGLFPYTKMFDRSVASATFVLFWYVLLAAPVFHAWYLLWFLPLAALLLPGRRPLRVSLVFSMTALLIIPYFETIRVWQPALLQNQFVGHLIGVPLLIGPPVIALMWPISPIKNSEV